MSIQRTPGYYWVWYDGEWIVALWTAGYSWYACGEEPPIEPAQVLPGDALTPVGNEIPVLD